MGQTKTHLDVQNYYGSVLQGSDDLQTNAACCTSAIPPKYVRDVLPLIEPDIIDHFYGCGSPIPCALEGLTVLDLGCGTGKDVYVLSKLVGEHGRVIGVDMTENQLAVARKHQDEQARKFGYHTSNVEFYQGYIEDLKSLGIEDESIDLVISNCVINLSPFKDLVFSEIFRVLKPGGELYFSDIFASRRLPEHLQNDPVLRGECLGGAHYKPDFLSLLMDHGINAYAVVESEPLEVYNLELESKLGFMSFTSETIRVIKTPHLERTQENYGQTATYKGTMPEMPRYFDLNEELRFIKNKPQPLDGNSAEMLRASRYAEHFEITPKGEHRGAFDAQSAKDALTARTKRNPVDLKYLADKSAALGHLPFDERIGETSLITPSNTPATMQINITYACNLACAHCYLECGPESSEMMDKQTMQAALDAFQARGFTIMDITGGTPELNPNFEWFVDEAAKLAEDVIVRTNMTLMNSQKYAHLPQFLAERKVHVVGSLPYPDDELTDKQRGKGVFNQCIKVIKKLNELGYGKDPDLVLDLVYNVSGPYLPPPQDLLEETYKVELRDHFGVEFTNLFAFNNYALGRFATDLLEHNMMDDYLELLYKNYNTLATTRVMCLDQYNVDYDGTLYDCEVNHVLGLPIEINGRPATIFDLVEGEIDRGMIKVSPICYSCTAGSGSSCGGSLL